ncbi:MAG: hypothetical protein O7C75_05675, partial [Verrucomicrobia bacterium]|nr:hypothetical protein [Verrucomicrobiota bacterium]
ITYLSVLTLCNEGEGKTDKGVKERALVRRFGVVDLVHVRMSSMRNSGGSNEGRCTTAKRRKPKGIIFVKSLGSRTRP